MTVTDSEEAGALVVCDFTTNLPDLDEQRFRSWINVLVGVTCFRFFRKFGVNRREGERRGGEGRVLRWEVVVEENEAEADMFS